MRATIPGREIQASGSDGARRDGAIGKRVWSQASQYRDGVIHYDNERALTTRCAEAQGGGPGLIQYKIVEIGNAVNESLRERSCEASARQ